MKRLAVITLVLLLLLTAALCGCTENTTKSYSKISIVCTIFPQYDWVRQILGDKANNMNLTLLLNSRIDLHNYQPSVEDIVKISDCDLFIYVGGESDGWVENALSQATNKNMIVINLLETLGGAAKIEELVEGMEEDRHDEEQEDAGEDEHAREAEYDEHVWLSLQNAQVFCAVITESLSSLDSGNAMTYKNNLAAYTEKLSALDFEYQAVVSAAPVKTLIFGDRFPFRYLVDDYGLDYFAAFVGCSAETEASFETIIFLAAKVDELNLKSIMVTESSDKRIAETVIRESKGSNQQILVLDAMQSVSSSDLANGATYLSVMESNLSILKEALK